MKSFMKGITYDAYICFQRLNLFIRDFCFKLHYFSFSFIKDKVLCAMISLRSDLKVVLLEKRMSIVTQQCVVTISPVPYVFSLEFF